MRVLNSDAGELPHLFILPSPPHVHRMLLLCRVTLGKPVEQFSATRIAHAPPGHHSVIGRPSVGGLAYPEYVIYRGEQVKFCLTEPLTNFCKFYVFCVHVIKVIIVDTCCFAAGLSRVPDHISHCSTRA